MKELADDIVAIVKDYHNHHKFQFTPEYILEWVEQFEESDREFILSELLHILRQGIYISEQRARQLLIRRVENLRTLYGFDDVPSFIKNSLFLQLQAEGKSQSVLLRLLEEELISRYNISKEQWGADSHSYVIYVDDIIATGGNVFGGLLRWLQQNVDGVTNLSRVLNNEVKLIVSVFCLHNASNWRWRLKLETRENAILEKVNVFKDYEIQNHPTFLNQRLNFAYPVDEDDKAIKDYFDSLTGTTGQNTAYRKTDAPNPEGFFSTPENRCRFERILLKKGIELLLSAAQLKPNHRPLGATFPSHKTFGTGTLFFTWRNFPTPVPLYSGGVITGSRCSL